MITGKDDVSLAVLSAFNSKQKIADVAAAHNISLDQAKRLKRYYNYSRQLAHHGHEFMLEQLRKLGLKGLVLAPLFKNKDYEGLATVLSQIDDETTRDELVQTLQLLEVKNKRIAELKSHLTNYQKHAEMLINDLIQTHDELIDKKVELQEQLPLLDSYPERAQTFIQKYVGPFNNGWALRKRLDSGFRRALQKKDILYFNQSEYVWEILDLDRLIEQYLHRLENGHYIEYNYERELRRAGNMAAHVSSNEDYTAVKSAHEELIQIEKSIEQMQQEIQSYEEGIQQRKQELLNAQRQSLHSFEEASISTNDMSERDLLKHADLQTRTLKWLYMQGAVACSELTLPNGRRADVIGYLPDGQVIIIEVKVSYQDYTRDEKWQEYLPFCDKFYFAMDFKPHEKGVGHLQPYRQSLNIEHGDLLQHACKDRAAIQMLINRALSKRFIYGFK